MSVRIPLTKGRQAAVDEADAAWASAHRWHITSDHDGRPGYARSYTAGLMHRALTDASEQDVVDHINGDTLDNRRCNLRVCSAKENHRNRRLTANSKTGFKGVTLNKGAKTFRASITVNKRALSCGSYPSEAQAAAAYDRAAVQHFGEYAKLNFDPSRDWLLPFADLDLGLKPERRSFGGDE